jgi:hypothetical protein
MVFSHLTAAREESNVFPADFDYGFVDDMKYDA